MEYMSDHERLYCNPNHLDLQLRPIILIPLYEIFTSVWEGSIVPNIDTNTCQSRLESTSSGSPSLCLASSLETEIGDTSSDMCIFHRWGRTVVRLAGKGHLVQILNISRSNQGHGPGGEHVGGKVREPAEVFRPLNGKNEVRKKIWQQSVSRDKRRQAGDAIYAMTSTAIVVV